MHEGTDSSGTNPTWIDVLGTVWKWLKFVHSHWQKHMVSAYTRKDIVACERIDTCGVQFPTIREGSLFGVEEPRCFDLGDMSAQWKICVYSLYWIFRITAREFLFEHQTHKTVALFEALRELRRAIWSVRCVNFVAKTAKTWQYNWRYCYWFLDKEMWGILSGSYCRGDWAGPFQELVENQFLCG